MPPNNRKEEIVGRILELIMAPKVDFELVNAQLDALEVEVMRELRSAQRPQVKRSN